MLIVGQLAHVIGADPLGGSFQRLTLGVGHLGALRRDLLCGKGHARGVERQPVKALGQLDHRPVAPAPDVGDDPGDGIVDIGAVFTLGAQQGAELGLEIGR